MVCNLNQEMLPSCKDLLVYSRDSAGHIVEEFLTFQDRSLVSANIVTSFKERITARLTSSTGGKDKQCNHITSLPAVPGSGKSTLLAHFPYCVEYLDYLLWRRQKSTQKIMSDKPPIISLVTFNSAMGYELDQTALGLRILFGVLMSTKRSPGDWQTYYERHRELTHMSGVDAVRLLREIYGEERMLFIGVDEVIKVQLKHVEKGLANGNDIACGIVSELGAILDYDCGSDVLITSLTPDYIAKLTTGSNRLIQYIPITPLNNGELDLEFKAAGDELVKQVEGTVHSGLLNPFVKNVLQNLHLFASGHPRTVQELIKAIKRGAVANRLKPLLRYNHQSVNVYTVIQELSKLNVFNLFSKEPISDEERDMILSVQERNSNTDPLIRDMLNNTRCTIFDQYDISEPVYRVTTSLASMFQMIFTLENTANNCLGHLSRAAKILLHQPPAAVGFQLAEMWERCTGLTIISRVQYLRKYGTVGIDQILGLDSGKSYCTVVLKADMIVAVAQDAHDLTWESNKLVIAPHNHPAYDMLICLEDHNGLPVSIYLEVKVYTNKDANIGLIIARKLCLVLWAHCKSNSPNISETTNAYFVLSMYGTEQDQHYTGDTALMKGVLAELASLDQQLPEVKLTIAFVNTCWDDHVFFQGSKEITASAIPSVVSLAQLVQNIQ